MSSKKNNKVLIIKSTWKIIINYEQLSSRSFILLRLEQTFHKCYTTQSNLFAYNLQVLELVCAREAGAVFEAGGLTCALSFIREHGAQVHRDTLHSAMAVVSRLCGKVEPQDKTLPDCVEALSTLLRHEDAHVADGALRCFASLADRFSRRGTDPAPLASNGLVSELLYRYALKNKLKADST